MFDKAVLSILLYDSEIRGIEDLELLEKVHLRFCKIILKLKPSTFSNVVYIELGRYATCLTVQIRMIKFWGRLVKKCQRH